MKLFGKGKKKKRKKQGKKAKKRIMPIKRRKKLLWRSVSGPLKTQERKH